MTDLTYRKADAISSYKRESAMSVVMDDNAARVNGRLTSKHLPTIDVLITVGVMGDLGVMGSTNNIKAYMESRNL